METFQNEGTSIERVINNYEEVVFFKIAQTLVMYTTHDTQT